MTCRQAVVAAPPLRPVVPVGSHLASTCDATVLGEVDVVAMGGATHLVTRVVPTGPRGLWQALRAVGAVTAPTSRELAAEARLDGLHLDPRVNASHLAFLATV